MFLRWSAPPIRGRALSEVPGWYLRVYALVDPDGTIRYVGKTALDLPLRLAAHLRRPTNAGVRDWLRSLAQPPSIRLITYACSTNVDGLEMEWIAWIRVRAQLLNRDPGGQYRDHSGKPRRYMRRLARRLVNQHKVEARFRVRFDEFIGRPRIPKSETEEQRWARIRSSESNRLAEISKKQRV